MRTENVIRGLVWIGILTLAGCGSGSSQGNGNSNQAGSGGSAGDMSSTGVAGEAGADVGAGGVSDSGGSGGSNDTGGSSDTGGADVGGSSDTGGTGEIGGMDSSGGVVGIGGSDNTGGTGEVGGSNDTGGTGGTGGADTGGAGGSGGADPGGCQIDDDCPLGQVCNVNICVDGCGPPTGGLPEEAMSERCPIGQACVPVSCLGDPESCSYECDTLCFDWPCHSDATHSYICWGRESFNRACMQECDTNSQCPDGQQCLSHSSLPSEPQGFDIGLCRAPCTTDDDCLNMQMANTVGVGDLCSCQGPGLVGAGHCLYNPTANGGMTCLYTDPP